MSTQGNGRGWRRWASAGYLCVGVLAIAAYYALAAAPGLPDSVPSAVFVAFSGATAVVLAVTALRGTITADPRATLDALLAVAATVGIHLTGGRRTILSVGVGTAVYVILVNAF